MNVVWFGEHEVRRVLYADHITIYVKDTKSIDSLQYKFDEFAKVSGLKVNKGKRHFLWMDKDNEKNEVPLFGNLVQEVKHVGVYF